MLFFIQNTIALSGNRSLPGDNREEGTVSDKERLHLVTHGDGLTYVCIVRINIFLAYQTHLIQLELLIGDATGL